MPDFLSSMIKYTAADDESFTRRGAGEQRPTKQRNINSIILVYICFCIKSIITKIYIDKKKLRGHCKSILNNIMIFKSQ